jgi:hypothetical protein
MKYLKQFIIGSSYPVFFSFYYSVKNSQPKKTYKYYNYTLVAPVWFGVWNIISLLLAERLNLTNKMRFLLISLLSSLSIMIIATKLKSYKFNSKEWRNYYFYILVKYLIVWNIVILNIEKNM